MLKVIKNFWKSDPSEPLSKKTAKGSFWLLIFRIFDQSLRLIRTIILARFLAPSDFGTFGITIMAVSFLDTFSQSGFLQALVYKKGDIKSYMDTSFIVQVIRGFLIASVLFVAAPHIALFFRVESAIPILRIVSFAILIQGFTNIATVYLAKELDFKKYFFYQISGTFADFIVSVVLAILLHNVWALAIGFLSGTIFRCVASYLVFFYKPKLNFNFSKAKELFGYGRWIFGSNIIGFFVIQIDSFFVAKMSGVASLGFYQIAQKIPSILGMEILAGATFPAYSKIQDDMVRLKEVYLKITKIFSIVLMPVAAGLFIVAADFIKLFLGSNWLPALWPMRFLCLSALVWTMAVISDYMFLAIGRPNIQVKWTAIRLLIMVVFLYPFIMKYDFIGASIVVFMGSVVAAVGLSFEAIKIIKCSLAQFTKSIIFPFMNAFIMAVLVFLLKSLLQDGMVGFLVAIVLGIIIYFLLTWLSDKFFGNKSIQLLKESISLLK